MNDNDAGLQLEWWRCITVLLGLSAIIVSTMSLVRNRWSVAGLLADGWMASAISGFALGVVTIAAVLTSLWRRHVRRRHSLGVAAAGLAVVGVLGVVGTHSQVRLGELPTWVSAVGAVFTAGGVLLAVQSYQAQQRDILEDQANQARLVKISFMPGEIRDGKSTWRMTIRNQSADPVFNIDIISFRSKSEDGSVVAMRAIEGATLGELVITASAVTRRIRLDGFASFDLLWTADPKANVPTAVCQFTLMDAKGRYWLVTDHYEPEKISKPSRPTPDRLKSALVGSSAVER